MKGLVILLTACVGALSPALSRAETVVVFAAGSLRGVVRDLAADAQALGIEIEAQFGGSGTLRERIENGDKADLFLSADLGSPQKLATQGRTVLPAIAFARNRMCVLSRAGADITATNLVERLLDARMRVKTSTPVADPSGDYAWSIFERIGRQRAGAEETLKRKAQASMDVSATASGNSLSAGAALFAENKIDVSITYCSAAGGVQKEIPGLVSFEVPAQWDPQPVYGAALLSDKGAPMRVALYLLSERGQALLTRNGLLPLVGR